MEFMTQGYFYACAALAVAGALITVLNRNPIRCAMGLLLTILSIAGLFMALHAQFLAAIQVIVYAGAIVVLFIFVIMLLGPSVLTPRDHRGRLARALGGGLFGLSAIAAMALVLHGGKATNPPFAEHDFGGIDAFGRVLFSDGLVPFELSSALLMVAVIGAVAVARGKQEVGAHATRKTGGALGPATVTATLGAGSAGEPLSPSAPAAHQPGGGH
jgi:NADH-quinone oxidoreductase subunit J